MKEIDWNNQYRSFKTQRPTKQRKLTKWFSGWIATGKNMMRWDLRYRGGCPFCTEPKEDTLHILHCTKPIPTSNWNNLLIEYDKKLIKFKTSYALRKAIILDLRSWRRKESFPCLQFADTELQQAIGKQRKIGWKNFLEGLLSKDLIAYQKHYIEEHFPKMKCTTWSK